MSRDRLARHALRLLALGGVAVLLPAVAGHAGSVEKADPVLQGMQDEIARAMSHLAVDYLEMH